MGGSDRKSEMERFDRPRPRGDRTGRRLLLGGAAALLAAECVVFLAAPSWRPHLIEENHAQELVNAALYLSAFLLGAWVLIRRNPGERIPRLAWGLPAAGLVAFLDETSFLGFLAESADEAHRAPIMLPGGLLIDGVHDLLALPFKLAHMAGVGKGTLVAAGLLFIGLPLVLLWRRWRRRILAACRAYAPYDFFRYASIAVGLSLLLDIGLYESPFTLLLEEGLETVGGLALLFGAVAMRTAAPPLVLPETAPEPCPVRDEPGDAVVHRSAKSD